MENLFDFLNHSVTLFGDKVAFQIREATGWRRLSFKQLRDTAEAFARALSARGLRAGDAIGILSENRPEWGIAFFSILRIGGVVIPIDKQLKKNEIQNILQHSETRLLITSRHYLEMLNEISINIPIICLDDVEEHVSTLAQAIEQGVHSAPVEPLTTTRNETAVIIYTSGTTGNPKGVMLSHGNLLSNVESFAKIFPASFLEGNFLSILPLNHAFELTGGFFAPLSGGGTITYQESLKPAQVLQTMHDTESQIMLTVPAFLEVLHHSILNRVSESPTRKKRFNLALALSSLLPSQFLRRFLFKEVHAAFGGQLRYFVSGGAPLSADIQDFFEKLGFTVLQGYGLTEAAPVLTVARLGETRKKSVGKPLPGVEVKIDGEIEGEILAKGSNIMKGYYKNVPATQEIMENDFLKTGDIGYFDPDGFLFISGRKRNLIVSSNGKNIFPEEIEEMLKGAPYFKDVCILGRKTGIEEEVLAVVIPDQEKLKTDQVPPGEIRGTLWQAIKKVNEEMADYKRVRDMMIWHRDFPKTTTLKVKRSELQKEIEQFVQEKIPT